MGWLVSGDYQPLHRKTFNSLASQISGTPTNIPLAIAIASDAHLAAEARTDGHDLAITKADGTTELDYERVAWDEGTGELLIWFKAPDPESGDDYHLYYGDADQAVDRQNATGVWDTGFTMAHHLQGASALACDDSTANNHDVTGDEGNPTYQQAGQIGYAIAFDGNDGLSVGDSADWDFGSGDFTIGVWANFASHEASGLFVGQNSNDPTDRWWSFGWRQSTTRLRSYGYNEGTTCDASSDVWTPMDTIWYYLVVTRSGDTFVFYVDAVAKGGNDDSDAYPEVPAVLTLGMYGGGFLVGLLDEVRISKGTVRSANWITTSHNNQDSPAPGGTFWSALITETIQAIAGNLTSAGVMTWKRIVALAGAITSAGAIVKKGFVAKAGALTSAGAIVKKGFVAKVGALTSAGTIVKKTLIAKAGALTSSGTAQTIRTQFKALTGALTSAGVIVKKTLIAKAGALTSAGAIVKKGFVAKVGALTSAGIVAGIKTQVITLTGAFGAWRISGVVGIIQVKLQSLSGVLNLSGVGAGKLLILKALAGVLTSAGSLVNLARKALTGALTSSGTPIKKTFTAMAGALTSSGTIVKKRLATMAGVITSAGAIIKKGFVAKAGGLTSAGAIIKKTLTAKAGGLTSAGTIIRKTFTAKVGTVTSIGALTRRIELFRTMVGGLTLSGVVVGAQLFFKTLTGTLTASGTAIAVWFRGIYVYYTRNIPHIFWLCPLCNTKLIWLSAWVHLRDVHSLNVSVSTDIRSLSPTITEEDVYGERTHYWCPICYRVSKMTYFHTKADLISHLKVFHV